jgi:hypothetical protein
VTEYLLMMIDMEGSTVIQVIEEAEAMQKIEGELPKP